jgi:diguanylate cyclase (GGDEF)-like protein
MHAYSDGLTGLSNRRALEQLVQDLVPAGSLYAFALADLDQFKRLNDTHGHEAGDKALRLFADVLKKSIRDADRAARWGGEEFAIFFPGLSAAQVLEVADRIRSSLAETLLAAGGAPFTASFGIADSTTGSSFEECVRLADEALYRSKNTGRDRATIASGCSIAPPDEQHVSQHAGDQGQGNYHYHESVAMLRERDPADVQAEQARDEVNR